ncbi:ABC transporter substrate-binding protein [Metamycoplasma equirhinis]|uniref:ABC transporter substrate-binding protein n=3 Tax=Metamycoplasma equirhinis TaxID=92402 RepID=A0ABZ0PBF0_9BACT|nr:ABC transporter substrate-binding protein [Metamycoplasma equirhinis]TPD97773.1 ABC transporter substrate-binding protein [Metamycoplasma equirhinis]WPB54180.1 ABC transporter substrate-binding protein [Metamycoplasma equirhinis]
MKKKILLVTYTIPLFFPIVTLSCNNNEKQQNTIELKDMSNQTIKINKAPSKIALQSRSSLDMMIAFGLGNKVDGAYKNLLSNSWVNYIYPIANNFYKYKYNEGIETYLERNIDLAIVFESQTKALLLDKCINSITINQYDGRNFNENSLYIFPEIIKKISPNQENALADKWISDTKKFIKEIKDKMNGLSSNKRIFYLRADKKTDQIMTEVKGSLVNYVFDLLKINNLEIQKDRIQDEEFIKLNPEYVIAGGSFQYDLLQRIKNNPKFLGLNFIKQNGILHAPLGFSMFEQLSVELPIFIAYLANWAYPTAFKYDIKKMIKECYNTYFNFYLSNEDIDKIYNGNTK